ncbi:MAG: hypothetical protein QXR17_08770 [Candidatus Bathyarchaeia archaeon]
MNEDKLLEQLAKRIVNSRLDTIIVFWLTVLSSMGHVWSQLGRLYLQPIIILLGDYGEILLEIVQDPNKVNKLITKIEELSK